MGKSKIQQEKLITIRSAIDVSKADRIGDERKVTAEFSESEFLIGTIAALTGHKDYPNLIEAAETVINKKANVKFIAIGDGKLKEQLTLLIKSKGLEDKFILMGYKENVYDYLKRMNIFVLASKLEGLGTSVLDALSCGKAIVATKAGGIPEMIVDGVNGLLVPKQKPEELAKAIIKLIENPQLCEKLSLEAKDSAQLFDISLLVEKHEQLYNSLI